MPAKIPSKKQPLASGVLALRYQQGVADGHIRDDQAQRAVLTELQQLLLSLTPPRKKLRFFKKTKPSPRQKSLYIWGNVGRGKSMLMDLFFEAVPIEKKRRVHFHAFMQEVYARIHELRKTGKGDPVAILAHELAQENTLLCFDELQATDVADATLLYRLFEGLFADGVCMVSTSNHPPASLYTGGVQAERFAKFITLIEERMNIVALSSAEDYRYLQGEKNEQSYYTPLGSAADAFLARIVAPYDSRRETLIIQGHSIIFTLYNHTIGYFTFEELCATALGAADYLALAKRLDTLILAKIPLLTAEKRNEAKRFVTLIDTLYEHKVKFICTAETKPENIYTEGDGAFEFHRTVSRLIEMQSANYQNTRPETHYD